MSSKFQSIDGFSTEDCSTAAVLRRLLYGLIGTAIAGSVALAQESDIASTPNNLGAGIQKSLQEQVGPGRGDLFTPGSSQFMIKRDPFRAIARGRQIFQRKFSRSEGLGPRTGDGVGNIGAGDDPSLFDASVVAGFTDSCAACHGRPRGSAGVGGNVFTRPNSRDAPHLFGLGLVEMIADEITQDLRAERDRGLARAEQSGYSVTVRLRSKGIQFGSLIVHPDGSHDPSGLKGVDPDLRVKPFFAQGKTSAMRAFIVGALNDEMGLESPDSDLLRASWGERVVTPSGMVLDGTLDLFDPPPVASPGGDSDHDGVVDEIDPALVDYLEFYLLNYFRPGIYNSYRVPAARGRRLMDSIGCTSCHVPDLVVRNDRRVADVDTRLDEEQAGINGLFATATPRFVESTDDPSLPSLKRPTERSFLVQGIFADFRRHDLGSAFWELNFDGTVQREFMTEPLWGVGSTSPYGHDGRSINLREVILRHGGEAQAARDAFAALPAEQQRDVLEFLGTLVLFPPPDTASNLDPADPDDPDFPLFGHGSIGLGALFNDPSDPE